MKPLKVLVTGATGMLGASLVPELRARGWEVKTQARTQAADFNGDLSTEIAARVLDEASPQVIVNLAALTNVDACEKNPPEAFRAHVRLVERLATWSRRHRATLIHLSTDQVYDGAGPHRESDVFPRNVYAWSKLAGELLAVNAGGTALRTNFFGRSRNRPSLSDWVVKSLRDGARITLFSDILFSPLRIATLCREIARVAEAPVPGIFNLGSRQGFSKAAFAEALARRLKLSLGQAVISESGGAGLAAYRPKDMRLDVSAYETRYGIRLPDLADEIAACGDDYEDPN